MFKDSLNCNAHFTQLEKSLHCGQLSTMTAFRVVNSSSFWDTSLIYFRGWLNGSSISGLSSLAMNLQISLNFLRLKSSKTIVYDILKYGDGDNQLLENQVSLMHLMWCVLKMAQKWLWRCFSYELLFLLAKKEMIPGKC